jgi:GT2 family glycosyltransferase
LLELPDVNAIVFDNASPDGSLYAVSDLSLTAIQLPSNGGFAHGVNAGWRTGSAP